MSNNQGIYQITNNEGAICTVNTDNPKKNTYGPVWASICESFINSTVLEATIERFQYRSIDGKPDYSNPTGFLVKIKKKVEAFLPLSEAIFRDFKYDCKGERIAVMVDSFDPLSLNLVVKEIRIADREFKIEQINEILFLVGEASIQEKYIRGTVIGEKISHSTNKRVGYRISISGLEAFLPCRESYLPYDKPEDEVVGHNILVGIKEICIDKMSIVLSMKIPYEKKIYELPSAVINTKTKGLVFFTDQDFTYLLLPKQTLGIIQKELYPIRNNSYWLDLTGNLVECIPYRKQKWNTKTDDLRYLVGLNE